jgi:hypothetical protein
MRRRRTNEEEPPIRLEDKTARSLLIEDAITCESLRRIVSRSTMYDSSLEEDAMQECRMRLCRLESERPGQQRLLDVVRAGSMFEIVNTQPTDQP